MSRMPRVVSAAPRLQARAAAARRERRTSLLRRAGWVLVGVAPLALLAWLLLGTSVLGVHKVVVSGEHRLTASEIRSAADVPPGTPLARVDTSAVARRVRALAEVASVSVTRAWPNSLRVAVVERTAAVAVPRGKVYDLLDGAGVRFDTVTRVPRGVVVLRTSADDATKDAALQVLRGLPVSLHRLLWSVRASSPQQVSLVLQGNRVVVWGSPDEAAQKAAATMALLKLPGRVYDVSSPDVVTRR